MRFLFSIISSVALLVPVAVVQAAGHGCDADCGCEVHCPHCDHVCQFSVDVEKDPKHCYGVECKPICIPKVVFPWQKKKCSSGGCASACDRGCDCAGGACGCCATCETPDCSCVNNGACVKYVRVLKKYEYECEKCKYKWAAVPGCGSSNGGCSAGCGTGYCDTDAAPVPSAAPVPAAAPAPTPVPVPPAASARYSDPAYTLPQYGATIGR